jgi:hypothetical protein
MLFIVTATDSATCTLAYTSPPLRFTDAEELASFFRRNVKMRVHVEPVRDSTATRTA